MAKTALAVNDSNNALAGLNDDFGGGPTGLENVTHRDLIIPRLTILQPLSPQLQKTRPELYIPGAEAGDFCDVSSGSIYRGTLLLLPVAYNTVYLEWAPRNSGRGLVANHGPNEAILKTCRKDERNKFWTEEGNYIAQTSQFFVINMTEGAGYQRSYIPLQSTQLKAARGWVTKALGEQWGRYRDKDTGEILKRNGASVQAPLFYRLWQAVPVAQSNNDGNWHGWRFSAVGESDNPNEPHDYVKGMLTSRDDWQYVLAGAKEFCAQAMSGEAMGDTSTLEDESGGRPAAGKDDAM